MKFSNLGHHRDPSSQQHPEGTGGPQAASPAVDTIRNHDPSKRHGVTERDVTLLRTLAKLEGANTFEVPKDEHVVQPAHERSRSNHQFEAAAKLAGLSTRDALTARPPTQAKAAKAVDFHRLFLDALNQACGSLESHEAAEAKFNPFKR